MKTERIKIEKFKAVENLEEQINGKNILLIGDNGVGKSSVIQFIEIALGKQSNVPPNAEGKGEVVFLKDGQEVTVKLDFRDGKPYIKVSGKGISIDNKKSAIAELFGAIDFDIDEFVDLSKTKAGRKEQVEIFKKFLPLEVQNDLKTFEANVQNHFNERAEVNKEVKRYEAIISANEMNSLLDTELAKFTESDSAALMAELQKIQADNAKIDKVIEGLQKRNEAISSIDTQITDLEAKIAGLKLQKEQAWHELGKLEDEADQYNFYYDKHIRRVGVLPDIDIRKIVFGYFDGDEPIRITLNDGDPIQADLWFRYVERRTNMDFESIKSLSSLEDEEYKTQIAKALDNNAEIAKKEIQDLLAERKIKLREKQIKKR